MLINNTVADPIQSCFETKQPVTTRAAHTPMCGMSCRPETHQRGDIQSLQHGSVAQATQPSTKVTRTRNSKNSSLF
jgi:hypothetical protein